MDEKGEDVGYQGLRGCELEDCIILGGITWIHRELEELTHT